jgi:signal transduction histidine kinase
MTPAALTATRGGRRVARRRIEGHDHVRATGTAGSHVDGVGRGVREDLDGCALRDGEGAEHRAALRLGVAGAGVEDGDGAGGVGDVRRVPRLVDRNRVALVHGPDGVADPDLAAAAARAAVLVLERVRLTTQLRLTADEVRRSAARLLAVDEQERQALAARLAAGPCHRLRKVRALLEPDDVARLDEVDSDLDRLARGLLAVAIGQGTLTDALGALAAGAALPVDLRTHGRVDVLPEADRGLAYFVVAECLTNVARHARASAVEVRVAVAGGRLRVEVTDDGAGGAEPLAGHGLQGLADRVTLAGGTLTVSSPAGGPTTVVADVPLAQ